MKRFLLEKLLSSLLAMVGGLIIIKGSSCFDDLLQYFVTAFVAVIYIETLPLLWKFQEIPLKISYKWLIMLVGLTYALTLLYIIFADKISSYWQWMVAVLFLITSIVLDCSRAR